MYIPCLNGIRAFAIGLVLISHINHTGIPSLFVEIIRFGNLGNIGVRLFFVLSGFLITTILYAEFRATRRINLKKFILKRILRIFPAFYFYLIVLFFLDKVHLITIQENAILFGFLYIQNFVVFQNSEVFATSWLVKHSWSLSVEEQFYLIYPTFLKSIIKIFEKPLIAVALITLICSFFRVLNYSYPHISRITFGVFFMHCDFLLYGGLIAIHFDKVMGWYKRKVSRNKYLFLAIAIIIGIFSSRFEYYSALNILIFGNLILGTTTYILLYFLAFPKSWLGQLFESKPMYVLGTLSYSLYIWQQLFLGSTKYWNDFKWITIFPTNIILVFLCATTSYLIIEKPFLKIKKVYT